jgi:hypothetical protein
MNWEMRKKAAMAELEAGLLSRHLPGETEENLPTLKFGIKR